MIRFTFVFDNTWWFATPMNFRGVARLFKMRGRQGRGVREWPWLKMAALHRPLYKVSFHGGGAQGRLGFWLGGLKARAVASLSLPGGQVTNISPIFPHLPVFALILPQFFLIFFLILVLRVGESPTREGPGYATAQGPSPRSGYTPAWIDTIIVSFFISFCRVWRNFTESFSKISPHLAKYYIMIVIAINVQEQVSRRNDKLVGVMIWCT